VNNPPLLLENLPVPLLERAFQFLCDPQENQPPKELQHLNRLEWYAVQNLLNLLLVEKEYHSLH